MLVDGKNDQNERLDKKQPLPLDWMKVLGEEFDKDYMINLKAVLASEIKQKKVIYPHGKDIFSAFSLTPFQKVKIVIIGQDPYHGPGQAHGLSFSVRPGVRTPPSLQNIYKELLQAKPKKKKRKV